MAKSMIIRKQRSGGRGEYEIVSTNGHWDTSDLLLKEIIFLTKFGNKNTGVQLTNQGGKNRLRLISGGVHIQRQVAGLFLLPKPIRDEKNISNSQPVIFSGCFVMDIECRVHSILENSATMTPVTLVCRSGRFDDVELTSKVDINPRSNLILELHSRVESLPKEIRHLIMDHIQYAKIGKLSNDGERITNKIISLLRFYDSEYIEGADPLPHLLSLAGIAHAKPSVPLPERIDAGQTEILLRSEQIYRLRRIRGASASRFRREVQEAYDFRCAFCGLRIPSRKNRSSAGAEAAHILPWGDFDLDTVQNGILLCHFHHWAFDNHLVTLNFDNGDYLVKPSSDLADLAEYDRETIGLILKSTGKIPEGRLPKIAYRPSPQFIDKLYQHYPNGIFFKKNSK